MTTGTSDVVAYVDTSALGKLLKPEAESPALEAALSEWDGSLVSSSLLEPELRRVAVRYGIAQSAAERVLEAVTLLEMDDGVRRRCAHLAPDTLRALDAVHLATALALGKRLAVMFVYDVRLTEAALLAGVPVFAPHPS